MNPDYINRFRFFIPPVIFLTLIFLLKPELFIYIRASLEIVIGREINILTGIIGTSFILLSLGFLISSFSSLIITVSGLAIKTGQGHRFFFTNKQIEYLAREEYKQWADLKTDGDKYLRSQIEKRRSMFTVNANVSFAILLALLVVFLSDFLIRLDPRATMLVIACILLLSFCTYSYLLQRSVLRLHEKHKSEKI